MEGTEVITVSITTSTTTSTTVETTSTTTKNLDRPLYLYEFIDQFSMTAGLKSFYDKKFNKPRGVKFSFSEWSIKTGLVKSN